MGSCLSGVPVFVEKEKTLLPSQTEQDLQQKCLVLDLDETLVHSELLRNISLEVGDQIEVVGKNIKLHKNGPNIVGSNGTLISQNVTGSWTVYLHDPINNYSRLKPNHLKLKQKKGVEIVKCTCEDDTEEANFEVGIRIRPYARVFLREMAKHYEVVTWTASVAGYAKEVHKLINEHNFIAHSLSREHCTKRSNGYVKDLSKLGRDLKNVIIIDNHWQSYRFQLENGIQIKSWFDDEKDEELRYIIPALKRLKNAPDVRAEITNIVKYLSSEYEMFGTPIEPVGKMSM